MGLGTLSDKYPWNQETFEKAYRVGNYTERIITIQYKLSKTGN